jgi:hypothetical protein
MKIKYQENGNFQPCPEYNGVAKIVDTTELTEYTGQFGTKEQFRFILEINEEKAPGIYHTVATKPMTPSFHEKATLRKFTEKVLNRPLTIDELKDGYETEDLIGKYCQIIVEHITSEDGSRTFANISYVGKAKDQKGWKSAYVRLDDRPAKKLKATSTEEDGLAEEAELNCVK